MAAGAQRLCEVVDLAARPAEHERRGRILDIEDPAKCGKLVGPPDDVGDLTDERPAVARRPLGMDLDARRVAQVSLRDAGDGRRDGGREQGGLTLRRRRRQDRLEVVREAHVEHLVGLVEDDDADPVEAEAAALEVVDRATRRGDHDVDPASQAPELLADGLAAVDRQDARAELPAVLRERLRDLHRELAGRDQDERRGAAVGGPPDGDALEGGQGERGGLARPGRCLGEEVAAGQQGRDRLALDRGRLLVAERRDDAQEACVELEGGETVGRRGILGIVVGGCRVGVVVGHATIVVHPRAVSAPRRPVRGRSPGRDACRPCRCAPWPPG